MTAIKKDSTQHYCFLSLFSGFNTLKSIVIFSLMLLVSACGSAKKRADIVEALPPPNFDSKELSYDHDPEIMERVQGIEIENVSGFPQEGLALNAHEVIKSCRIKDRFDRKALLAYEWSGGERLSLDVDGLGIGSQKIDKVYLQYKISLQPELEKRDPCKYASAYQGLLGSVYQELVVHEGKHLSQEVDHIKSEVSSFASYFVE